MQVDPDGDGAGSTCVLDPVWRLGIVSDGIALLELVNAALDRHRQPAFENDAVLKAGMVDVSFVIARAWLVFVDHQFDPSLLVGPSDPAPDAIGHHQDRLLVCGENNLLLSLAAILKEIANTHIQSGGDRNKRAQRWTRLPALDKA